MNPEEQTPFAESRALSSNRLAGLSVYVFVIVAVKLLVHLYANRHYGYFVLGE